jgi:hypothetical protein
MGERDGDVWVSNFAKSSADFVTKFQKAEKETEKRAYSQQLTSMLGLGERQVNVASTAGRSWFPWWKEDPLATEQFLLASTALTDGRSALLVDVGAWGGLAGENWMLRQSALAIAAGYKPTQKKLEAPIKVSGVGNGSQEVEWEITTPITITAADGDEEEAELGDYTAPIIPGSNVPGLWGLKSIRDKRGLLDTFSVPPRMYLIGPGDYELKLPPGSKTVMLEDAPSGHLLMPVSDFSKLNRSKRHLSQAHGLKESKPRVSLLTASAGNSLGENTCDSPVAATTHTDVCPACTAPVWAGQLLICVRCQVRLCCTHCARSGICLECAIFGGDSDMDNKAAKDDGANVNPE